MPTNGAARGVRLQLVTSVLRGWAQQICALNQVAYSCERQCGQVSHGLTTEFLKLRSLEKFHQVEMD